MGWEEVGDVLFVELLDWEEFFLELLVDLGLFFLVFLGLED